MFCAAVHATDVGRGRVMTVPAFYVREEMLYQRCAIAEENLMFDRFHVKTQGLLVTVKAVLVRRGAR